ncbi:MAG: inositol monophosphatase family protein [Candidatus Paceibacteria bacterium]
MITKPQFENLIQEIEIAGRLAHEYFVNNETSNEQKGDGSVVTEIDKKIEDIIITFVRKNFPDDTIIGEEGEDYTGSSDFVWHIDPIDGTDNFLRKIPFCAVSVARLGSTDEDSFAVVHNPITKQTYSSYMDEAVYENQRIHQMTDEFLGGRAMISIARGREAWMKSASYNVRKALGLKFGGGNSFGCCALEHTYVAANRIDGVLTFGLNSYDYAAGLFLIKSAGGMISVFEDGQWQLWRGSLKDLCAEHGKTIFSSHGGIHADALTLIGNPRDWSDE